MHHFGSRDQLLGAIINQVRDRLLQAVDVEDSTDADLRTLITRTWMWMSSPQHDRLYRLLFEIYGNALQHPERYQAFLAHVVDDWLRVLVDRFRADGADHESATAKATLVIATCRGLLLDLLTTGDTERVTNTFNAWLASSQEVNS